MKLTPNSSTKIEVEIKSLLGSQSQRDRLIDLLKGLKAEKLGTESQLNHYFHGDSPLFNPGTSVRTRAIDHRAAILFVKKSISADSSENGLSRIELEIPTKISISELDEKLVESGLSYLSKWSRVRESFQLCWQGLYYSVSIDRNSGYGYVCEVELTVTEDLVDFAKDRIYELLERLGLEELPQDRLERMFAHYNQNWENYYGTNNVFEVI